MYLDDKYYICIKRWAYRDWYYTLREWEFKSSPDSCVKCYTMFLPFLLIKIDVFS